MKQPTIEILNSTTKHSWGVKKVHQLNWNSNGILVSIKVDFLKMEGELLAMVDYHHTGIFMNMKQTLMGTIKFD